MILRRMSGYSAIVFLLAAGMLGMVGCANDSYLKRSVKGPQIFDSLRNGVSAGAVEGGQFTKEGWQPGPDGFIRYELPPMPQGMISMDVTGLSRTAPDAILFTLFEDVSMKYVDPFITKNPFLVTLTAKNFQKAPDSPFDLLWTIKNFPAGTEEENRYIDGIPEGVAGYERTLASSPMPIFPDKTYRVQVVWEYGKAKLVVNGEVLAEHDYQPSIFGADSLILIVGKSPLADSFGAANAIITDVWASYPSIYRGGKK
ncbi:MAG: hypothetical protein JXR73_10715 [Candidatus Omnitrophica bacterium]|nr:hypothetical protein [Candidatus Omnitrophota bacterium]